MNVNPNSPEIIERSETIETMDRKIRKKNEEFNKNESNQNCQLIVCLNLSEFVKKHNAEVELHNIQNHYKAELEYGRDDFQRTTSMLSHLSGFEDHEVMTTNYKYITTSVLWYCYFSLALNDYIFGPTFDDLSKIFGVPFEKISVFPIVRQVSYTLGALGGFGFNYMNRQLTLVLLLILSSITLILTPHSQSLTMFFVIGAVNGFAAGACDIGFHVWIIEMFVDGGGPLLQALHFAFGFGITIAPLITTSFLSDSKSQCLKLQRNNDLIRSEIPNNWTIREPAIESSHTSQLYIPYTICAAIVCLGAIALLSLYCFKKYIPPKEPKVPRVFNEQMPKELSPIQKLEIWRNSMPSYYMLGLITISSSLLFMYYGLEVTYFTFMAEFVTSTPLPISGGAAANVEAATGGAYALGGALSIYLSTRLRPEQMLYFNFLIINIGNVLLVIFATQSLTILWVGNVLVGLGFSSTYASIYTFLEHQISVTNAIGSVFLFAGGAGTALLPLFLSKLCENSLLIVYLSLFCTQMSLILFFVLHIITKIRSKEIDMIKKQLIKSPAILLGYKHTTFSALSI